MSDNLHAMMDESDQMPMYRKASDCRRWEPEMPQSVGLYHAHVKVRDARQFPTPFHRLVLYK